MSGLNGWAFVVVLVSGRIGGGNRVDPAALVTDDWIEPSLTCEIGEAELLITLGTVASGGCVSLRKPPKRMVEVEVTVLVTK